MLARKLCRRYTRQDLEEQRAMLRTSLGTSVEAALVYSEEQRVEEVETGKQDLVRVRKINDEAKQRG